MHNRDDHDFIIERAMSKLDTEIDTYLKEHPVEYMPPQVRNGLLVETPKLRYRARSSRIDPGWTRKCEHCSVVQYPICGAFETHYHLCEMLGTTVEWPPSIGRDYA
jgi:hypothetical protein